LSGNAGGQPALTYATTESDKPHWLLTAFPPEKK
jgi:hypothetical protein